MTVVLSAGGSAWRLFAFTSVILCLPVPANVTLTGACVCACVCVSDIERESKGRREEECDITSLYRPLFTLHDVM